MQPNTNPNLRTVSRWAFFGFIAIALYFLTTEHRAHLVPFLPFVLLAACPLLHLFHHRGHGHGNDNKDAEPQSGSGRDVHQH